VAINESGNFQVVELDPDFSRSKSGKLAGATASTSRAARQPRNSLPVSHQISLLGPLGFPACSRVSGIVDEWRVSRELKTKPLHNRVTKRGMPNVEISTCLLSEFGGHGQMTVHVSRSRVLPMGNPAYDVVT
jgi:hypothetical protein